jgi:hypothetical protein
MPDKILNGFLARQREQGLALAAGSDLLDLAPIGATANRYVATFRCRGLLEKRPGEIVEADCFQVGIRFGANYLRSADTFETLTWFGPHNVWHPNISNEAPFICIGRLAPGTDLVDILYQVFEVITWNKVTMLESDALNRAACQWARAHRDRFPVDRRPLKRRGPQLECLDISPEGGADGRTR